MVLGGVVVVGLVVVVAGLDVVVVVVVPAIFARVRGPTYPVPEIPFAT